MNELRRYAASSIHMEELSEFHDRVRGDKKKKKARFHQRKAEACQREGFQKTATTVEVCNIYPSH